MKRLLSLLILGFTLLSVTHLRAAECGYECLLTVAVYTQYTASSSGTYIDTYTISGFDHTCTPLNRSYSGPVHIGANATYYYITYRKYFWHSTHHSWYEYSPSVVSYQASLPSADKSAQGSFSPNTSMPGGCPACTQSSLNAEAIAACGNSFQYVASIDYDLCTFICVPCGVLQTQCSSSCFPKSVAALSCTSEDNESGNPISLNISQPCECKDDTDCIEQQSNCASSCGGSEYMISFNCDTGDCQCREKGCNDLYNDCLNSCGGDVDTFVCGDSGNYTCTCKQSPGPGDPKDYTTPPDDPDTTNPNEQQPAAGDTDSNLLEKIVKNTSTTSENVRALNDTVNRELNELNRTSEDSNRQLRLSNNKLTNIYDNISNTNTRLNTTNEKLGKIYDKLAEDQDSGFSGGFELTGSSTLPDANSYDTNFTQPEEVSLADTVSAYIANGLPLSQFIQESGFSVRNIDPKLTCNLWGDSIDFDISPMESILHWMGLIVFAVSTISAFMIVIKR